MGFPYGKGKGSLQIKWFCYRLFAKESSFGEGSLQSYVFMEKPLRKESSFLGFVKGFSY